MWRVLSCTVLFFGAITHTTRTQSHTWMPIPSTAGYNVGSIEIVRSHPETLYLTASPSTFARSTDYGQTWDSISAAGHSYSRVRSHPLNPSKVLVLINLDFTYFYRSTDGGHIWSFIYLYPDYSGNVLDFDPLDPDIVYAGYGRVILRSLDGGGTWTDTLAVPQSGWMSTFAIHPQNSSVLYLGSSLAVLKSTDRGTSWVTLPAYTPTEHTIISVVVDPSNTAVVYAGILGGTLTQGTIKKSTDSGATWFEITDGFPAQNKKIRTLAINPKKPSELLAGMWDQGGDAVYRSTNEGETWESYSNGMVPLTVTAIEFDTTNNRIYVGGWGGSNVGLYVMDRTTSIHETGEDIPSRISLRVYPNPFNSVTKLQFTLPAAMPVSVRVLDMLGREVLNIPGTSYESGEHELDIDASGLASGVYVVSLHAGSTMRTAKLLLAK